MARPTEPIKKSEARIMVYLSVVQPNHRTARFIDEKLEMDYSYTLKLLRKMEEKGWINTVRYDGSNFYGMTLSAPITEAKDLLAQAYTEQTKLK